MNLLNKTISKLKYPTYKKLSVVNHRGKAFTQTCSAFT